MVQLGDGKIADFTWASGGLVYHHSMTLGTREVPLLGLGRSLQDRVRRQRGPRPIRTHGTLLRNLRQPVKSRRHPFRVHLLELFEIIQNPLELGDEPLQFIGRELQMGPARRFFGLLWE